MRSETVCYRIDMKMRLRLLAYLLLATTLAVIGLPGHAAGASAEVGTDVTLTAADLDCPFHTASAADSATSPAEMTHDCCGPDCRCACASLSMLVVQRVQSPLNPLAANLPHSASSLLAALYGSRLLRPPQA